MPQIDYAALADQARKGKPAPSAGNVDLYAQPKVKNPDGTTSTVDSRSYSFDGLETLLPSVTPDGRHLKTDAEIVAEYKKTGRHLGQFQTVQEANTYAEQLHNDYAAGKYDRRPSAAADYADLDRRARSTVSGPHPEARIGPPADDAPVTLGDLEDNPAEAFKRLGVILKRDLTDKRNWVAAAAAYFGPQILSKVAPIAVRALRAGPEMAVRGVAKVGDAVSPDVVGVISPRAGRALEVAQRVRDAMRPTASVPVETVGGGAPSPIAAAPPAPVPPAPPARDMALPPSPRPAATARPRPIPAAMKLKLTAEEYQAARGLVQQGYEPSEVLSAIQRQRLPEAWKKLPSDSQVRAKVAGRNAKGQWPEDSQ